MENESAGNAHFEFPVTESASLPAEKTGAGSLQIFIFTHTIIWESSYLNQSTAAIGSVINGASRAWLG